ncbi:MAG TPA: hypothetical protein VM870_01240, partial [Pyrinomonadaceae bacterium]|nr:hypothetical protein [Pyrinomonadaceae bacterium]
MIERQTTEFGRAAGDERPPARSGFAAAGGRWLDHAVLAWVFVCAAFIPHSIAAAQIAWGVGLSTWAIRRLLPGAPPLLRSPLDYPLFAFFALSIVSSFFSYDPEVSVGKLRAASLFTIVYFVAQNVRSRRTASALAVLLIVSCGVNVLYTVGERILGRGVKVEGIAAESVLRAAGIEDGDTLLRLDGRSLHNLADVEEGLRGAPHDLPARVQIYRFEGTPVLDVPRGRLLAGATPEARLGVSGWARGRDWRATGFYGHYTTYAEVLQL